ncbi:alpha-hydroxy acid oxidase [Actinotalea fermentans]|uniref:Alpha-hydroxy-acid oxidizing enzyme n=1 Tax=Actinotalea fermentans TaxID=43671 RepID=A0A511YX14_9CELL|nr:alpha-hydroxy acid oxidase [Actinotalea fermentans]GEN79728.1 alpha-hydroxy-acid oxidizing enzyme [Actinotalea fermentans]
MALTALEKHERDAVAVLPAAAHEFFASGSGDEVALDEATAAWARHRLRPRVLRDVGEVDLTSTLLGCGLNHPIGVAPVGYLGLAHPDAEPAVAAAAREQGALYVASTRASTALEDIAAVAGPWWFQVYVMRHRELTERLVERAVAAGARALVLTGDTPFVGIKRRVGSQRIAIPDETFLVNLARHLTGDAAVGRAGAEQDPTATLEAIGWLARMSGLPVLVKGVLRGDDAVACLDAGAAGVVVSNHGGRQLDRSVATPFALAEVVRAVRERPRAAGEPRPAVLVDGGVRSGVDALVGLALGADAVLVGRPVVWGLATGGQAGVHEALAALRDDLAHAMALAGAPSLADLDASLVVPARD